MVWQLYCMERHFLKGVVRMEQYDTAMESRVWQRVRGAEEPSKPQSLQALAAAELSEAAVHLMLSRQLQGKEKTLLRRIFEEDQNHASCLKGMHSFQTDSMLSVRPVSPAPESPSIALRKCYARKLKAAKEYETRISDPEYGPIFQQLAKEEWTHCRWLLEMAGKMAR